MLWLVALVLYVGLLIPMPAFAQKPSQQTEKPLPAPVGLDYVPAHYQGRVVAMTDKTMTLKLQGFFREDLIRPLPNGTIEHRMYIQDNNQPPKEVALTKCVFPGPNGLAISPNVYHLVTDVRAGDIVLITCERQGGIDQCGLIKIQRRPGGKVPPALGDATTTKEHRWDVRCNTEQAAEEKAAAVLERFGRSLFR